MSNVNFIGLVHNIKDLTKGFKNCKTSKLGEFPLIYATYSGNSDIVKLLIENGAKVNWKDRWGNTALKVAKKEEHKIIEKILIDNGSIA